MEKKKEEFVSKDVKDESNDFVFGRITEIMEEHPAVKKQFEKKVQEFYKKVELKQLIQKKLEKDGKRNATKEVYVKSLDGTITVKSPSDTQKIEFADKTKTGSYVDMMEAYSKLIYDCCPMLRSKELQKEIGVDYPYDTVKAIFDMEEITEIGIKVLNFFNGEEENNADEKLKN